MSTDVVYSAIRGYLDANWQTCPLRYENEPFVPPLNGDNVPQPWVAVEIAGNSFDQVSIGTGVPSNDRWREEGMLWMHVFVLVNTGSLLARQYASTLIDLFRGTQLDPLIEFRDMSVGLGAPGSDDGNWWCVSAAVEWIRG
jgi:hypothetical protein